MCRDITEYAAEVRARSGCCAGRVGSRCMTRLRRWWWATSQLSPGRPRPPGSLGSGRLDLTTSPWAAAWPGQTRKTPLAGRLAYLAERGGFEPPKRGLDAYTLSRRAPSTTRTPLREAPVDDSRRSQGRRF